MTDDMEKKANDAWAFLIEETHKQVTILPGEKTQKQFASEAGIPVRTARRVLEELVEIGKFTVRKALVNGKSTNVYKPKLYTAPK